VTLSALAQDQPIGSLNLPSTQYAESAQLAQQYVKADKEDQKKEIRKKLADALSQQFDVHIKKQQKELEDVEKQVGKLREVLKKRVDAKATIVERRVEQLVQEAEGLGWSAPSGRPQTYPQQVTLPRH
jgi:chromosome segregation ATPase